MIRFIKIGDQICEDENHFAYWNTITDKFLYFDGDCVFDSWEEFMHYYEHDDDPEKYGLERLMGVTPDEFIDTKSSSPFGVVEMNPTERAKLREVSRALSRINEILFQKGLIDGDIEMIVQKGSSLGVTTLVETIERCYETIEHLSRPEHQRGIQVSQEHMSDIVEARKIVFEDEQELRISHWPMMPPPLPPEQPYCHSCRRRHNKNYCVRKGRSRHFRAR